MEKGKILITVQPIEKKRVWKNPKKKPEFPGQKKPKFQEQMQIRDTISGDVLLLMNPGDSKILVTRNLETPEYVNPSSTKKIIKDWMRKHRQGV
ncbi:MAG: hypothetical protein DDT40_01294 [candidate division WS2 bacterium]|nr:hypothetical protein [Candidatus Psychracetigena formicireducens]